MQFRKVILVCLALLLSGSTWAVSDTLSMLGTIETKGKKTDTAEGFSMFEKFEWLVNVDRLNSKMNGEYITREPDSLFTFDDLDTVTMYTDFAVAPQLMNKVVALHYHLEGSLQFKINDKAVLQTGLFQHDRHSPFRSIVMDDYLELIFSDTVNKVEVKYIPDRHRRIFELSLKVRSKAAADEARKDKARSQKEDYGTGFYYLAFCIVFLAFYFSSRDKKEVLYFSLFCLFAALSSIWGTIDFSWFGLTRDPLGDLSEFFGIFCFEFLSIFFCKVLKNREKSKIPLMIIAGMMVLCAFPFVKDNLVTIMTRPVPLLLGVIIVVLYGYTVVSSLVFLVMGVAQKRWEARAVVIICFIPIVLCVITFIGLVIAAAFDVRNGDMTKLTTTRLALELLQFLMKFIVYVYPLAAVIILARRNALNQRQLIAQVASIRKLSEENLNKEKEKKQILEGQKESLEHEVSVRTAEIGAQKAEIEQQHDLLKVEKQKSDDLLRNILPEEVAEELKRTGTSEARLFDNVTVLFADFVDFTLAGEHMSPQELVNELHVCFKQFDHIISEHSIEKIKTIGDAYLAVCGMPVSDPQHAIQMVRAALEISQFMEQRHQGGAKTFRVRIGIHTGSVVAGIVGVKKFAYDIWGDTVNTAARMEQSSEAGKVNISQTTYELIKDKFECEYRGEVDAKNKGKMKMYFVKPPVAE